MANTSQPKPLFWIASTRDDLREFPNEVRQIIGYGLYLAQMGDKHLTLILDSRVVAFEDRVY